MTNFHLDIPETLVAQGKTLGFLRHSDLEAQIPAWNSQPEMRDSILAWLAAAGVETYPDALLDVATMGHLEFIEDSTPARISLNQLGTGQAVDSTVKCRFSYVCEKSWRELESVPGTSMLNCNKCERSVELCFTVEEASDAIARKQCVALVFQHVLVDSE